MHRLPLCREIRYLQWVSWIWHQKIWWWVSCNAGDLMDGEYPFIAMNPRSTLLDCDIFVIKFKLLSRCCIIIMRDVHGWRMTITPFIRTYLSHFILERGWNFCGVRETDGQRQTGGRKQHRKFCGMRETNFLMGGRAGRNSTGSMEDQTIRRHTAPPLQRSIQSKSDR